VDIENKGKSTEPLRFSDVDLAERKISYGSAGYAMQFMLDSRLSDIDKFPLKISDLIVTSIDNEIAPERYVWARDPDLEWDSSVPNVAFAGERYYRPMKTIGEHIEFTGSVLAVDPAGRGKDETGYAVVKMLNGYLYVPAAGGLSGGYSEQTLTAIAEMAKEHKVNCIITESNFGDGMFNELLKPYLTRIYPVSLEEVRHSTQKEKRIIDTLEPVMSGHRLVVDPDVVKDDYETIQKYPHESQLKYSLFYQMSRLTRERGAITHDDRLDALSIAVAYWTEQMAQDAEVKMRERKNDMLDKELRAFQDAYYKTRGGGNKALVW
jgi:molybdopterin biosynthesis enzyme MoaB